MVAKLNDPKKYRSISFILTLLAALMAWFAPSLNIPPALAFGFMAVAIVVDTLVEVFARYSQYNTLKALGTGATVPVEMVRKLVLLAVLDGISLTLNVFALVLVIQNVGLSHEATITYFRAVLTIDAIVEGVELYQL